MNVLEAITGANKQAVTEARAIKPEFPMYGFDNIPSLHEIEFEKILKV